MFLQRISLKRALQKVFSSFERISTARARYPNKFSATGGKSYADKLESEELTRIEEEMVRVYVSKQLRGAQSGTDYVSVPLDMKCADVVDKISTEYKVDGAQFDLRHNYAIVPREQMLSSFNDGVFLCFAFNPRERSTSLQVLSRTRMP